MILLLFIDNFGVFLVSLLLLLSLKSSHGELTDNQICIVLYCIVLSCANLEHSSRPRQGLLQLICL